MRPGLDRLIRPGKAIREMTLSTETAKKCVDFAAERGIDYIHFDAGWYGHEYVQASDATTVDVDPDRNPVNDLNLLEVIRYARTKHIGVLLYVNRRQLEKNMDILFPLYRSWGVAGVKFGFVNTGTHRWVEWVNEAVRKAAGYGLLVNIHDEYRPTGLSRTWPNLLTQEGIRGNEEMPDADHNTALPFTRYLSGAGDYTYCYYYRKEFGHEKRHVQNTPAHQLALPVVFYSPLQYLYWYDSPADYGGEPELELWKIMPTVWNKTVVLDGEIGGYASVARQAATGDWFVGTVTDTTGRTLTLTLDFLTKGRQYRLTRYADGPESLPTRTKVAVTTQTVRAGDKIRVTLKPSGGEAWHIVPMD
ncbi:glycoside hydrolase family 97 catalytic domain-containing protein [Rikenella microfusus]|uniref:glycoside hydrolase family 97 catalytic domain-containing protein n=1 Tax=Rikenella microfusus TaxID=28139 RepID=UPI00248D6FE0|nr:glycoside hydrolase family 97 catalytic domain-containing protein [Rikenella microfusus]